jgi:hypothetical protein
VMTRMLAAEVQHVLLEVAKSLCHGTANQHVPCNSSTMPDPRQPGYQV